MEVLQLDLKGSRQPVISCKSYIFSHNIKTIFNSSFKKSTKKAVIY